MTHKETHSITHPVFFMRQRRAGFLEAFHVGFGLVVDKPVSNGRSQGNGANPSIRSPTAPTPTSTHFDQECLKTIIRNILSTETDFEIRKLSAFLCFTFSLSLLLTSQSQFHKHKGSKDKFSSFTCFKSRRDHFPTLSFDAGNAHRVPCFAIAISECHRLHFSPFTCLLTTCTFVISEWFVVGDTHWQIDTTLVVRREIIGGTGAGCALSSGRCQVGIVHSSVSNLFLYSYPTIPLAMPVAEPS